ncbi:hypothetical protein THASP1DRAFT_1838, partial [Thamnocephalis sphaerospora]
TFAGAMSAWSESPVEESHIHILINNAGIMDVSYALTTDGIESLFGVNHVGPTLFTQRLLPAVQADGTPEDPARIVFTSSMAHMYSYSGGVRDTLNKIDDKASYEPWSAYGQSKLAKKLAQLTSSDSTASQPNVLVNAVHPGLVQSELLRSTEMSIWSIYTGMQILNTLFGLKAPDGALATLYAATSNEVREKHYNSEHFVPYGELATPSANARNDKLHDAVWTLTQ